MIPTTRYVWIRAGGPEKLNGKQSIFREDVLIEATLTQSLRSFVELGDSWGCAGEREGNLLPLVTSSTARFGSAMERQSHYRSLFASAARLNALDRIFAGPR